MIQKISFIVLMEEYQHTIETMVLEEDILRMLPVGMGP